MPNRYKIIDIIGKKYYESNIENGEFSYPKALKDDLKILKEKLEGNKYLDIRFTDKTKKVSVLVETKAKFNIKDEEQLFNYVELEKRLEKTNDIIAILANTTDDKIKVWKVMHNKIEKELLEAESKLKSFSEYTSLLEPQKANDKEKIIQSTYELNEILHKEGIDENLRSQFVGTILLSLKNGLNYNGLTTSQILAGIKEILNRLVEGLNKAEKLVILDRKIIQHEHIRKLESKNLIRVLDFIKNNILPYINDNTNEGQDLLNLFFTTFNKYVGKKDKNQAFTPDHIVHFMCKVAKVDRNSRTLDPTCGSGAFLVQAMVQSLKNCRTEAEKNKVKKEQIYGIEYEEQAFGLATTNMLIHGDGNTNVINADCFKSEDFIRNADINVVLMNPPYNAQKKYMPKEFTDKWSNSSTDPSKGFYFVNYVSKLVGKGKLLCLLPLACAIGNSGPIEEQKEQMLENNTLEAVFTLPNEMFYPGASVNACCMVFTLNKPHPEHHKTFFGYFKDDGFKKKKNLGRIDKGNWNSIEDEWLNLFENKIEKAGLSVVHEVTYKDEWLAEAYMETDYSKLTQQDFEQTINDYLAYLVKRGDK